MSDIENNIGKNSQNRIGDDHVAEQRPGTEVERLQELLCAYVLGECDEAGRAEIERALAASDALRSERPYKPAFSHEKSVDILTRGDERIDPAAHFDPKLVELFRREHVEMARIWDSLQD